MQKSWFKNLLSDVFGSKTNSDHWLEVKSNMEEHLGPLVIHAPDRNGKTIVTFMDQVLIGNNRVMNLDPVSDQTGKVNFFLAMNEPIGRGRNPEAAVMDMWKQLTSLPQTSLILRHNENLSPDNPAHKELIRATKAKHHLTDDQTYAEYQSISISEGQLYDRGTIVQEGPPPRSQHARPLHGYGYGSPVRDHILV
jgi:hypothetical protein